MNHDDSSVGIGRRHLHQSSQGPFQDAGNVHVFYGGGGRGAILDTIVATRRSTFSAVHVHGERGSGRTLLSLVLADRLGRACNVIRHEPARLEHALLLRHLLIELCPTETGLIDADAARDGVDAGTLETAARRVSEHLRRPPPGGRPYLLVIDAGEPDAATLALLERLAGVRLNGVPAMNVVVFRTTSEAATRGWGRAGSGVMASARPNECPPRHHFLRRLTLVEVGEYIAHRMMLFDFNRRDLFTREMVYFLADRSDGVIGTIDTLARNAFTLAGLEDDERPSLNHLLAIGLPPPPEPPRRSPFPVRYRRLVVALAAPCAVASVAALFLLSG